MVKNLHNINHKREFSEMNTEEKIMWFTDRYESPHFELSKEEARARLASRIAAGPLPEKKPVKHVNFVKYWVAAASIIFLISGIWALFIYQPVENIVAEKGQHADYRLPDGTFITLNADSKISFSKKKFNKQRQVQMDGEAFFNVQKGSTFTINTPLAAIKILGTSFNVFSRDNIFKVSCFTGKIIITSGLQSSTITPGEMAYLENNTLKIMQKADISTSAQWRVGEFNFENASLNLVLDEIERQFNVTFVASGLTDKDFTGSFTNRNLVEALDIVCIPMGLTYEIGSNSKIYIKPKAD
jgi:transmembrane sensor